VPRLHPEERVWISVESRTLSIVGNIPYLLIILGSPPT
jgi:hypothetical protein